MTADYLTLKVTNAAAVPFNLKGGTVYMTVYGDDIKIANNASEAMKAPGDGAQLFYLPASTEPAAPMARDGPQIYKFKGLGTRIFIAAANGTAYVSIMEV